MARTDPADAPQKFTFDLAAIRRRKAKIAEERGQLKVRLKELDEEEGRLELVLGYAHDGRFAADASKGGRGRDASSGGHAKSPRITHRVLVLLALERRPEGASVKYLVDWAAAVNMTEDPVVRTSVSPLLRKMSDPDRNRHEVGHDADGRRWVIRQDGQAVADAFKGAWVESGHAPFWELDLPVRDETER